MQANRQRSSNPSSGSTFRKVIEAVKGLLAGGALDAAKDAISGIADTAADAAGAAADKAEEAAKEGGGILSGAINAFKKLF